VKHFAITQWTDYVRGVGPEQERMKQHLSECDACARVAGALQRLTVVASRSPVPEVPDDLVRSACAIFSLNKPEKVTVSRLIAKLMYDSFREPLPAGVRSQTSLSRHALYEAGDYCIDLRIEYKNGDDRVDMVGQVVSKRDPNVPAAGSSIVLKSGSESKAQTKTNKLGEFQLAYEPATRLRLHIPMEEKFIEVPLAEVAKKLRRVH